MERIKAGKIQDEDDLYALEIYCPPCGITHNIHASVQKGNHHKDGYPVWKWCGSTENPTLSPSIRVNNGKICHFFVRNGRIEYCSDSWHELRGKSVDLTLEP